MQTLVVLDGGVVVKAGNVAAVVNDPRSLRGPELIRAILRLNLTSEARAPAGQATARRRSRLLKRIE